jgi:hypothetical protein
LLSMSLSSCHRYHPAGVVRRFSQFATSHAVFTPRLRVRPPDLRISRLLRVHFRYGPTTCNHPKDGFVDRLQNLGLPPPCYPSYGALTFTPAGLSPAEHASLSWTHNRAGAIYAHGSSHGNSLSLVHTDLDPRFRQRKQLKHLVELLPVEASPFTTAIQPFEQ